MKKLMVLLALASVSSISLLQADFKVINKTPYTVTVDVGFKGFTRDDEKSKLIPNEYAITRRDLWNPKTDVRVWTNFGGNDLLVAERRGSWNGNREIIINYNPTKSNVKNEAFSIYFSDALNAVHDH